MASVFVSALSAWSRENLFLNFQVRDICLHLLLTVNSLVVRVLLDNHKESYFVFPPGIQAMTTTIMTSMLTFTPTSTATYDGNNIPPGAA